MNTTVNFSFGSIQKAVAAAPPQKYSPSEPGSRVLATLTLTPQPSEKPPRSLLSLRSRTPKICGFLSGLSTAAHAYPVLPLLPLCQESYRTTRPEIPKICEL